MRQGRYRRKINDFSGGLQAFTSPLWSADNESPFIKNADIRKPGILSKALGYSQIGSTGSGGAMLGMATFENENGTNTLYKKHLTQLYRYNGSAWASVATGLASGDMMEGVNAYMDNSDRLYFALGHTDTVRYTGDAGSSSAIANTYAKYIEQFNGRLYLGNVKVSSTTYPHRVLFSAVGADTFDTATDYFDDIGLPITALRTYAGALYVFTENSIGAYDGYALRRLPVASGTTSARSVLDVDGRLMWYNRAGVYVYGGSGLPQLVSRQVQPWIEAVSAPTSVAAGLDANGRYCLWIGDVTVDGTAYSDVVLRYDPLINAWDVLVDRPFSIWTRVKSGGSYVAYAGDPDNDKVWVVDSGTSLNGSAIASEYQTAWLGAGEDPEDVKNFYKVYVTFEPTGEAEYLTLQYRTDGASSWSSVGGTANNIDLSGSESIETVEIDLPANVQGRYIQFRITHSSGSGGFTIYELGFEYDNIG